MGTDTDAGKTLVCGALALAAEAEGRAWRYYKPAESGGAPFDTDHIARWTRRPASVSFGYRFQAPLAPWFAAELEGASFDMNHLQRQFEAGTDGDPFIVEGAGGVFTPYAAGVSTMDLALRWRLPVLLVTANRLGCLNHALLSLEALAARDISVAGCVFVDLGADDSMSRNVSDFSRLSSVPVVSWLRRLQPGEAPSAAWWREGVARAAALR